MTEDAVAGGNTKVVHGQWHHLYLIIGLLVFLYLIAAIGVGVYYTSTRCPYSSLVACQSAVAEKCGSLTLDSAEGCSEFVNESEPCFCHECRFCLGPQERNHCARSADERLGMCVDQLGRLDDEEVI